MTGLDKFFILEKKQPCYIISYVDVDIVICEDQMRNCILDSYDKTHILQNKLYIENGQVVSNKYNQFNIDEHYEMKYIDSEHFRSYIKKLANNNTNNCGKTLLDWYFVCCVDKTAKKTRIYMKINHSKCDGILLMNVVKNSLLFKMHTPKINEDICKELKQPPYNKNISVCDKIYYHTVGFVLLFILNIKVVLKLAVCYFRNTLNNTLKNTLKNNDDSVSGNEKKRIRYIECNPLSLIKLKAVSKYKNITINDLLFSIMVRADNLYYKKKRELVILCPFSSKNLDNSQKANNNFVPIAVTVSNYLDKESIIKKVSTTLNSYKHSSFVLCLYKLISLLNSYININIFSLYSNGPSCVDYVFTNMIGPDISGGQLTDIHFFITPRNNEMIYNTISAGNKLNIICSFIDETINKSLFEKCIYEAYKEMVLV